MEICKVENNQSDTFRHLKGMSTPGASRITMQLQKTYELSGGASAEQKQILNKQGHGGISEAMPGMRKHPLQ